MQIMLLSEEAMRCVLAKASHGLLPEVIQALAVVWLE